MKRKIINIDKKKCNGCGACADACHEGAIAMVGGVATLMRDDYCDGLGDCLPVCPTDAISFVVREAAAYDEAAVKENMKLRIVGKDEEVTERPSCLTHWPVQIKLAPVRAPYFQGADLLIAADCTAYAYASFHEKFIKGRIALVGCPKLDGVDYSEKLAAILAQNDISSVTLVRMEVPCCGGLQMAAQRAIEASGRDLDLDVVTISTEGDIL